MNHVEIRKSLQGRVGVARQSAEIDTSNIVNPASAADCAAQQPVSPAFNLSPENGVRGIDAYRETWLPFFKWQAKGATFEIVELHVTAGEDVAFAYALLRCGTPEELRKDPDNRLRLSVGLRKENEDWLVAHEHHSFPAKD